MRDIAPVAETGFIHILTAYKIVGHFFGLSYLKISGSNQVKNIFFRISNISVPSRMLSSEVAQSLKSYGHFSDLGVGLLSVTAMLDFSGEANTSIHGLGKDDTTMRDSVHVASKHDTLTRFWVDVGLPS